MAGAYHVHTLRLPCGDPESLFERVETARGPVPRERWIQEAIRARLELEDASRTPVARLFASTSQPDAPIVKDSRAIKAAVQPIPKGVKK